MLFNRIATIAIALALLSILSCSKDEDPAVKGCTDPSALNFNAQANESDGSCTYEGGFVFYHDMTVSNNLASDNISTLKYYVDGELKKSQIAAINWFSIPDCDDPAAFADEAYDLGGESSIEFDYSIRDQNENDLQVGTFTVSANTCQRIQFLY